MISPMLLILAQMQQDDPEIFKDFKKELIEKIQSMKEENIKKELIEKIQSMKEEDCTTTKEKADK
jgi:hypothetical protein